jgi:hypothetical protein
VLLAQFRETRAQHLDALADQPAVGLELGFTRAAQADTALLAFKVGPAADQACGQVLQLGQFDLQLALVALRALREDVEDQAGTVDHAHVEAPLQVTLLGGRQGVVEDDDLDLVGENGLRDLVGLAAADEIRRIGTVALRGDRGDRFGPCRARQQGQFFQAGFEVASAEIDTDQCGAHGVAGNVSHRPHSASCSRLRLTARAGTTVEIACL